MVVACTAAGHAGHQWRLPVPLWVTRARVAGEHWWPDASGLPARRGTGAPLLAHRDPTRATFAGTGWSNSIKAISTNVDKEDQSFAVGIFSTSAFAGGIVATALASMLLEGGWRAMWVLPSTVVAAHGVLVSVPARSRLRSSCRRQPAVASPFLCVQRTRPTRVRTTLFCTMPLHHQRSQRMPRTKVLSKAQEVP